MSVERYITNSNNIETHWRSLILFGSNTACYKFALGETLLENFNDLKQERPNEELITLINKLNDENAILKTLSRLELIFDII